MAINYVAESNEKKKAAKKVRHASNNDIAVIHVLCFLIPPFCSVFGFLLFDFYNLCQ
jgi:hypothetical protein